MTVVVMAAELSVETAGTKEGMTGANLDEEGEWGEEDEGFPLGSENNDVDEDEADGEAVKNTKSSSSRSGTSSSSKSHHKSGSERRRKHHHRHHHGSSSGGSSSRSERRRRKSAAASSLSLGDPREESDNRDRDFDGRDALNTSARLGQQQDEDGADPARRGSSSSRRRSDSFGDKVVYHHDNQQAMSPNKITNSHEHHSSGRRRRDSSEYGEGGGGDARPNRRKDAREHHGRRRGERSAGGGDGAAAADHDDEAEDGEILEDGELDDDDDAGNDERPGDNERNERSESEGPVLKSSRGLNDKHSKYSPADRKRSSADYRDRWNRDTEDKKRSKKLYSNPSDEDEGDSEERARLSKSPSTGPVAAPAWGSGVSQAAATKASPSSGTTGPGAGAGGYRNKPGGQQGGRYSSKSAGHGGQSPPGLYDSPSYSEDSEDGMGPDGYMDADDKDYDNMRMRRAKKRGRDLLGDGRKRGGPPRKKTLMEMAMSERPVCKFYMDGKCAKGSGCPFNHDVESSPRMKMEVLQNYPCKYYHTGAKCFSGDRCKFSHAPLTEETRRALALRVAAEDIVDMEDPEYRNYRDYSPRDYDDDDRDFDQGDYNDPQDYPEVRSRPSLLGSPPRTKKIPSLFEIKVTPPGQSPQAGSVAPTGRQPGFHGEPNTAAGAGNLNNPSNMGAMGVGGGLAVNMSLNQQQMGLRQGLGLLGPGGPLPARGPNAAMIMNMQQQQQQQQQLVRPGFGLAGAGTSFMGAGNNANNLQQQRGLSNNNNNGGNLPPVLNMLGSLIRDLQGGPGSIPTSSLGNMANNMGVMAGQSSMGNIGQNNMGPNHMGPNNMGNMGHNSMANMGQNNMASMGNMGQNNMGNMGNMGQNNMGNMGQNMGNMGQNNMGNMGQNNMANMGHMPPNSMGNMGVNMANRNAMTNIGSGGQVSNGMAMGPGNNMAMTPGLNMNNPNMGMASGMNMGQVQPNMNSMGPGLLRPPMTGAGSMQQAAMNNNVGGGGLNTGGNIPVSGANMYNNNNNGSIVPVSNPGQEVGIMDVDYRVGQQQPQGPSSAGIGGGRGNNLAADTPEKPASLAREEKKIAEEEDSSQDLSELDKMRRQLEEQLRAEDERAAAEDDSFEEEAREGGGSGGDLVSTTESSEEKSSASIEAENNVQEDPAKDASKASEAVVDIPASLPRKQRELLKRIQLQEISRQREKERQEAAEKAEAEARAAQEAQAKAEVDDFYSSEEEGDDENGEKKPKLTDVLKKLNQETSSTAATSASVSAPVSTASSSVADSSSNSDTISSTTTTTSSTTAAGSSSTFNIMQMIQAIKSKTGGNSLRDQSSEAQQASSESKKPVLASPASPPASPSDKDQASVGLGLRLQPLTVDPPVVSARPLRPLTYSVVKLSLSQARPYSQLPAGVTVSDSKYRSDPRVKWHAQYMERQLKKKASVGAAGGDVGPADVATSTKRKASLDEDTIASPTQDNTQKPPSVPADPRLKKADPRLQKASASPNSSGSAGSAKAVDPRLERAANRPQDPRLAARAMDPRLNRQNSLPVSTQSGFNNQIGPLQMGGGMNTLGGPPGMNTMAVGMMGQMGGTIQGNPQMNMGMQNHMGGFRNNQMGMSGPMGNQMGGGPVPGQMGMGRNNQIGGAMNNGPRNGPMNNMANNSMMMAGGMNRMGAGAAGLGMGMGGAGPMGNQPGGPMNSMGVRPQMQGGIFVSGGGDMSTVGQAARGGGLPGQMMNSSPQNMPSAQQGPGDITPANLDPRLGGGPRPPTSSAMLNDPRLKNRPIDPRDSRIAPDPRDLRGGADPRDPRGSGLNNPKDPRSRDPRSARQFMDNSDMNRDTGSPNLNECYAGNNNGANRLGWPANEERNGVGSMSESGISSGINNPPAMPASLSQPPLSSLPPSLSLTSTSSFSTSSPPQTSTSSNSEKPSGVSANFDHRNDPRFKRVKRSAGPRAASMNYSSPLGGEQDSSQQTPNSSSSDASGYNSYNRPKPAGVPRPDRHVDTPSPTLPDTLEDFDMPEMAQPPDVKDIFKSIDPTASPFC
ncbi:zinc finger CCCH domain-containing protein 6 [Elysia marginata]|uniref:Zinc finger CCCH domain-containing protein 6 n=1 Tax=Elysia marginata TaxID=1093978 RepID=A0AAV4J177_9GAST|nr:zinc finger CCCH domain-containing protein 6 [Elysia marginata]